MMVMVMLIEFSVFTALNTHTNPLLLLEKKKLCLVTIALPRGIFQFTHIFQTPNHHGVGQPVATAMQRKQRRG